MTNKVRHGEVSDIACYNFRSDDKLLVDANIWIFLYGAHTPQYKKVQAYSDACEKILASQCKIYTDLVVLSEVINTLARNDWKLNHPSIPFKAFRSSPAFKPRAKEIAGIISKISGRCRLPGQNISLQDIASIMEQYRQGGHDFNDQLIMQICMKNNLILVTDDADFKWAPVSIITANQKLLN